MVQNFFNLLKKRNLSPNQYYLLWHCKKRIKCDLPTAVGEASMLQIHGFLDEQFSPTPRGEAVLSELEEVFRKTSVGPSVSLLGENYLDMIQQYRNKFPAGKKGDREDVVKKMSRLFFLYPDTTWETVLKATELYLSEQPEEKYVMKANNFLEKDGVRSITEYLERIQDGEDLNSGMPIFKAV